MGFIDLLIILIILLSMLFALYRGLVRELLGIAAWILAGFAALYSYGPIQPIMGQMIENQTIAGITGALIIALIVLVVMTIINSQIASRLRDSSLNGLDRILGLAFGLFRAGLLISVIYIGLSMALSQTQLTELEKQNKSLPYIQKTAAWVERVMPQKMREDLQSYGQQNQEKIGIDIHHEIPEDSILEPSDIPVDFPDNQTGLTEADKESFNDMLMMIETEGE